LQQNYTKVQIKQLGPGVGVSFKRETPTPLSAVPTHLTNIYGKFH